MRAIKSRRSPRSSIASKLCAIGSVECSRLRAAHARSLGAPSIFRRDQQQAFRFGLLQRGGTLDLMQHVLCPAIALIAGMAPNDLGRRFERTNRLVGMCDEVNWRMNRMLRHARQTVPQCKSSTSRSGNLDARPSHRTVLHGTHRLFLKIAAFAHSE
jgi:hypothetical protein